MNCKMDVGSFVNIDVDNSIESLQGFKKQNYSTCEYNADRIIDIMRLRHLIFYVILYRVLKTMAKIVIYYVRLIYLNHLVI